MCANMLFNLVLIWPLQHTGLALATALSSWMNALWLLNGLVKRNVYRRSAGWALFLCRIFLAVLVMVLAVVWINVETHIWFDMTLWERVLKLLSLVLVGVVSYFVVLQLTGMNLKKLVKGLAD